MELLLIVGHHALDAVGVEIPGDLREQESRSGELKQGPLKQIAVVCFKVDLALAGEDLAVAQQKVRMGEPPFGVTVAGPGVAEIDVDAVHLTGGEKVGKAGGVAVNEKTLCRPIAHTRSIAITIASGTRSTAMYRAWGFCAAVSAVNRPLPQPSSR